MLEVPEGVDAELLAKVLSNLEMAVLLTSLAKSMQGEHNQDKGRPVESKISTGFIYEIKSEHVRKRGKIIIEIAVPGTDRISAKIEVKDVQIF